MSCTRHHILVLAAGKGSRMGVPKALMRVHDMLWWQYQQQRLAKLDMPQTWVVSKAVKTTIQQHKDAPSQLIEADENAPMFQSLLTGINSLDHTTTRGIFVLPVDVPAPMPSVWQALALLNAVAVPQYNNHAGHPIYLPWNFVQQELLNRQPFSSDKPRLDRLVAPILKQIKVGDPDTTTNLNTPKELELWLKRQSIQGGITDSSTPV